MQLFCRFATIALLLLGSTAVVAESVPSSKDITRAARYCRKGDGAMKKGDAAGAEKWYRKALEQAPRFPEANIGLGQAAMASSRFDDALGHFEAARDAFALYGEALRGIRAKRYGAAQREINQMQDSIQQLGSLPNPPANAAIVITQLENRISQLQAVEPPGDDFGEPPGEVHFYIGNALYSLGRRGAAIRSWETCREMRPKFPLVYVNLTIGYLETGRPDVAKERADRAVKLGMELDPGLKDALERALANQGDARG